MPRNIQPLSEAVSTILPKQWAETPRERAEQLSKVQRYLAAESHFPEGIPEEEEFNVSFQRGLLMSDIQSYYGSPGFLSGIKKWFINNVFKPVKNFIVDSIVSPIIDAFKGAINFAWGGLTQAFDWIFSTLEKAWSSLKNIATTIYNKAKTAITDALGDLATFAGDIWQTIKNIASIIYNQAAEAVSWAVQGLVSTAGSIWNAVKNFGSKVFKYAKQALDAALDPLWSIIESVKRFISGIWGSVKNVAQFLGELPERIWNGLQQLGQWVKQIPGKIWKGLQQLGQWVKQIPGKIWDGLKNLGRWIYQGAREALTWITENIVPRIRGFVNTAWTAMKSGVTWLATKVFDTLHWIWDQTVNFAHIVASGITGGFKKVITSTAPIFADFADWTLNSMVIGPMKAARGEGSPDWWHDIWTTVEDTGESLMKTILEYVMPEEEAVTFDKANEAAGRFLNIGLFFGMADSMVTMGEEIWDKLRGFATGISFDFLRKGQSYGEAIVPTQQFAPVGSPEATKSFGGIAKFFKSIYYSLGLGFMMWTIWSGSLQAVMGDAREEHYRRVYKTKYPQASTFKKAFSNQMTLPNSNESWLSTAGYNPMYRDMIKQLSWNRLSKSQIETYYGKGYIKEGELWDYVKWLGYRPQVANWMIAEITQTELEPFMDDMADAYEEAYEVGTVSYDEAISKLQGYGYSKKKAKYTLEAIDKERTADFREDVVDELVDLLEDGEISEDKFMREASKFIVQPHLLKRYMILAAVTRGDISQVGTIGTINEKMKQLKHRISNIDKQIESLVSERSETREIYQHRVKALKRKISKNSDITTAQAEAKIEKLQGRAEKKDEQFEHEIRELREEREELQLDLEAMEAYRVAG